MALADRVGLRSWKLRANCGIKDGHVTGVAAGLMVDGREEILGAGWRLASAIPDSLLRHEPDKSVATSIHFGAIDGPPNSKNTEGCASMGHFARRSGCTSDKSKMSSLHFAVARVSASFFRTPRRFWKRAIWRPLPASPRIGGTRNKAGAVPTGLGLFFAHPALKGWARIFRLAVRDLGRALLRRLGELDTVLGSSLATE